tara:strand:+ start:3190 stop:3648 length:459 start_codon:yes stop_codon:yes gene_type:complete
MIRDRLSKALKTSMKEKNPIAVSTLRLILTAIKDRDIAARSKGTEVGISDDEILQVLQTMVRQRKESIEMYQKGNREELADREKQEIAVIKRFMPKQLDDAELEIAINEIIETTGANSIKDMGKAMGALREKYAGQMDFGKVGPLLKKKLTG